MTGSPRIMEVCAWWPTKPWDNGDLYIVRCLCFLDYNEDGNEMMFQVRITIPLFIIVTEIKFFLSFLNHTVKPYLYPWYWVLVVVYISNFWLCTWLMLKWLGFKFSNTYIFFLNYKVLSCFLTSFVGELPQPTSYNTWTATNIETIWRRQ